MSTYSIILSIHVITAILGLGPLAAVTILTAPGSSPSPLLLAKIMRIVMWSLGIMLITGGTLAGLVHGAFEQAWWLRLSVLLFLFLGFLHSRVRRVLRKEQTPFDSHSVRRINQALWSMCVCVAVITWLMQAKPI